jgi:hypothetical protein
MKKAIVEWLPIETAPRDGSTYMILRCKRPGPHTCVGTYYNGKWKPIHADISLAPTHWQPLPKPPQE